MADPTRRVTECTVAGCQIPPPMVRGLCSKHYARWKRHGDTETVVYVFGSGTPATRRRKGRAAARRRVAGRPCYLAPSPFCSPIVHVHHVNRDPLDNRPENLMSLCARHHLLVHRAGFDVDNPDHSRFYLKPDGSVGKRDTRELRRQSKAMSACRNGHHTDDSE